MGDRSTKVTCWNCGVPQDPGPVCVNCGAPMVAPSVRLAVDDPDAKIRSRWRRKRTWAGLGALVLMALAVIVVVILSVPDAAALGIGTLAAAVPAFFYFRLIVRLDRYEPDPRSVLLGSFAWGAVGAVFFALIASLLFEGLLEAAIGTDAASVLTLVVGAPLVEETCKGLAVLALLLFYRREFDSVLDGLVYGALVGLGFAMTENILYLGGEYLSGGLDALWTLFLARVVIDGLGHSVYTATTGAAIGFARSRYRKGMARGVVPFLGWSLAVVQHMLWNGGLVVVALLMGPEKADTLSVVMVMAAVLTLPGIVVMALIGRSQNRRELQVLRDFLPDEVRIGALTAEEYAMLTTPSYRKAAMKMARRRSGRQGQKDMRLFFAMAADLAFRRYHHSRGESLGPDDAARDARARMELARVRESAIGPSLKIGK